VLSTDTSPEAVFRLVEKHRVTHIHVVPALLIPVFSPSIGHSYAIGDALIHAMCIFIVGSMFYSLAFLLSTVFSDVWRPWLIVVCAAIGLSLLEQVFSGASRYSVFRIMSAEAYFRGGGLPWLGLLASVVASAGVFYSATLNIARRDF